jgi:hypothetical protein
MAYASGGGGGGGGDKSQDPAALQSLKQSRYLLNTKLCACERRSLQYINMCIEFHKNAK